MKLIRAAKRGNMPVEIKAVLFDYDGVIADTMADKCLGTITEVVRFVENK